MQNIAGTVLPLVAPKMLASLGVAWSGSVLGSIALTISPVPFLLVRYGHLLDSVPAAATGH